MELLENYRYSIHMKTGYKILNIILAIVSVALVVATTVMPMKNGSTMFDYFIRLVLVVFLMVVSFLQITLIQNRVDVYKGKILYFNGIKTKEYKLSEIYKSKTEIESSTMISSDGLRTTSYDYVTTFYDISGRKLFKFGSAFKNIELLQTEVKNTQKSIANNKKSKKTKGLRRK